MFEKFSSTGVYLFFLLISSTRIDGVGYSFLLNWSSLGTGVQRCSLFHPQHLEECQAHLTLKSCPICPCPESPQQVEDGWPWLNDENKKTSQFPKWKQKCVLLMSVRTNQAHDEEPLTLACAHKIIFTAISERLVPLLLKMCRIS